MRLHVDYALVGGGLQNGLCALALRAAQPAARIALIERGARLGGNHTWCFHSGDLPASAQAWVSPLIVHRWPSHDVAFPGHRRHLESEYACISTERFHDVVSAALPAPHHHLLLEHDAESVESARVTVRPLRPGDGAPIEISAGAVIDARGPDRHAFDGRAGFQKFVGLEIRCAAPHHVVAPILMDATVAQLDGFRFFYVLPLAPDRLLVEDTYFSDTAYLDVATIRERIFEYLAAQGLVCSEILREETGVLPLPWHMDLDEPATPLVAGYQGGWFHPVTGYSFPVALRVAQAIAATPAQRLPGPALLALWRRHAGQLRFAFRLNWMLFRWFAPEQRFNVLERFYRLPMRTIRNFYAFDLSTLDRARILVGRPPRGLSWRAALSPAMSASGAHSAKEPQ